MTRFLEGLGMTGGGRKEGMGSRLRGNNGMGTGIMGVGGGLGHGGTWNDGAGGHKGRPYGEWLGVGRLSVGWRDSSRDSE